MSARPSPVPSFVIEAEDHQTSEVWLIDADAPASAPRSSRHARDRSPICRRAPRRAISIITTNSAGAEDFRICETPVAAPGHELAGARSFRTGCGRAILETLAYQRHLVRLEMEDGLPRIVVRRWSDGAEHVIAFAEEAYALELAGRIRIRYRYAALHLFLDDDARAGVRLRHGDAHPGAQEGQEIPSGHDPVRLRHASALCPGARRRRLCRSRFSIIGNTPLDGSAPLLLYGYGSYGDALQADFSALRLSFVDRGFIFAPGPRSRRQRQGPALAPRAERARASAIRSPTSSRSAEHLVSERHTGSGRIIAMGESAGGTLAAPSPTWRRICFSP